MSFQRIDIVDARQLISDQEVILADIRDAASYEQGHIDGAIHINNETISDFIQNTAKDTPVLAYCYHGNMSQQAAEYFSQQGFQTVYSLDGGFEAWSKTP